MGLFGSLLAFAAGVAGSIVGAASVNFLHGRCPRCKSTETEVVPAYRTVADYSSVGRIVDRGVSLSVRSGAVALEKYWATQHLYGHSVESWQTAQRNGKTKHSMATHRMAASELFLLLTEEARNSIAGSPDIDWAFIILQREQYRNSPKYVRESIRLRYREVLDGSKPMEQRHFGELPNPSADTLRVLMRQISFLDPT